MWGTVYVLYIVAIIIIIIMIYAKEELLVLKNRPVLF